MAQGLNVAKRHIVEYAQSGWFSGCEGSEQMHNVLTTLGVGTDTPEYENDFEIERKTLERAVEDLHSIDKGVEVEDIDVDDLTEQLDKASMTLSECIECFEWILNNSDKENEKEWIYVSFF